MSHPAWDAWIEIGRCRHERCYGDGRIPHGMRGLKSSLRCWCLHLRLASHPAWDAWIEMPLPITGGSVRKKSHPAWDAWIEIISFERFTGNCFGRIPHGMRGLKSALFVAR